MSAEQINFKLEIYDGPLDLLLTLITKQKINIYDIPIAKILDQYLEYMELCQLYNADLSSEFIVMACELLYIALNFAFLRIVQPYGNCTPFSEQCVSFFVQRLQLFLTA